MAYFTLLYFLILELKMANELLMTFTHQ